MGKKICENCEQVIGNLEESFYHKNLIVCKGCKTILEQNFQTPQNTDNTIKSKLSIIEEN